MCILSKIHFVRHDRVHTNFIVPNDNTYKILFLSHIKKDSKEVSYSFKIKELEVIKLVNDKIDEIKFDVKERIGSRDVNIQDVPFDYSSDAR